MLGKSGQQRSHHSAPPVQSVMGRGSISWPVGDLGKTPPCDIFVDTQFANHCGKEDPDYFAEEPWQCYGNAPNVYLSIRFDKRTDFMEHLLRSDPAVARRVHHEIDRIETARRRFAAYEDKKTLISALGNSYQAWRKHVTNNLAEHTREVEAGYPERPRKRKHQAHDLALLRRIESSWNQNEQSRHVGTDDSCSGHEELDPEPDFGFKACAMYFVPSDEGTGWVGHSHKHDWLSGNFPNQKTSAHRLLQKDDKNPLTNRNGNYLRYFHFPTNNMGWIEQAMARYYGEDNIVHDDYKPHSKMTRSEKMLCREFWRGQMHGSGGKAPVHARHMRARCSLIPRPCSDKGLWSQAKTESSFGNGTSSAGLSSPKAPGKNIALFLPYLHWETDSRRAKMVEAIKSAPIGSEDNRAKPRSKKTAQRFIRTMQEKSERSKTWAKKSIPSLRPSKRTVLGEYLMNLSKVADAMDYVADEKLLKSNLYNDPPLHVRRTLDQYYFLTLDDTSARDRDQVVYRETRPGRSFHSRTTRIVMVDQLWLWILDDNTIITSFPRRWGRNKPDPSGVHKCLRERLTNDGEIKSIHHLALIIIDQCSRVFFDRTKPLDQRPEVIDIFGSAIGSVTEHTTIAFDNFWRNTALHSWTSTAGHQSLNHKYLEINPEGTLLRESHDLVEELTMMLQVFNQQYQVVKDFRRHLGLINGDVRDERDRLRALVRSIAAVASDRDSDPEIGSPLLDSKYPSRQLRGLDETVQEADLQLEMVESRKAELQDLKDSALRTCQQLERLLSLKQQQASIVEAKAALQRADESVKQGRAVMAFTLVTIFFLPLGFFAAFFGMNNKTSTGDGWMTLSEQVQYMFLLSAIVISIAISIAFSRWVRVLMTLLFHIPLQIAAEYTGLRWRWTKYQATLQRRESKSIEELSRQRQENDTARQKEREEREAKAATKNQQSEQQDEDSARLRKLWNRAFPRSRKNYINGSAVSV